MAPPFVDRLELTQQLAGMLERCGGRSVEPIEIARVRDTGGREVERERREVGVKNLWRRAIEQLERVVFEPEAIADAGSGASGATAPLVGRGLRHAHRIEARHSRGRIEARDARVPRIDHDADALDREARLGDRGREDDLSPAVRVGADRAVLARGVEGAVKRRHDHIAGQIAAQCVFGAGDLAGPGKKNEYVSGVARQRGSNRRDEDGAELRSLRGPGDISSRRRASAPGS